MKNVSKLDIGKKLFGFAPNMYIIQNVTLIEFLSCLLI